MIFRKIYMQLFKFQLRESERENSHVNESILRSTNDAIFIAIGKMVKRLQSVRSVIALLAHDLLN